MVRSGARIRFFVPPGGGETVRAFAIFAGLLAVLVWAAHAVAFQDMSELAKTYRLMRATQEAQRVADAVISLGRSPIGMDFYRLRRDKSNLEKFLAERLADRPDLRFVEVRDRFGARVVAVPPGFVSAAGETFGAHVTLMAGGVPQGEVRVGVSTEAVDRDIEALRRSLRIKVVLVAALGVALLVVGLSYSLYLLRRNRELEQDRKSVV